MKTDMSKHDTTRPVAARDLLVAAVLLTRLPIPAQPKSAFTRSAEATWAYPLVGAGLGLVAAVIWTLAGWLGLPPLVQSGLALAAVTVATGALHEDGLADTADGFWGGYSPERRLDIMRDSRIGSYGVLALIFGIGLRWSLWSVAGPWAGVAAATLSRTVLPGAMAWSTYARSDGLARSVGTPPTTSVWLAVAVGLTVGWVSVGLGAALLAAAAAAGLVWAMSRLARAKIGGITGDVLGASQQVSEIGVLLVLAAVLA